MPHSSAREVAPSPRCNEGFISVLDARWYPEEMSSVSIFALKLMDLNLPWVLWASSMPRPQVWLHLILVAPFPLKSVLLANAKIKPDAHLCTSSAERAWTRQGPSREMLSRHHLVKTEEGSSGCQKCPSSSLAPQYLWLLAAALHWCSTEPGAVLVHAQCQQHCLA